MGWRTGEGPVRSSALELEIFVLWTPGPTKDPSLACVLGRGQDVAKLLVLGLVFPQQFRSA